MNDNINSERLNNLHATGLLQSLSVIALDSVWQALCFYVLRDHLLLVIPWERAASEADVPMRRNGLFV